MHWSENYIGIPWATGGRDPKIGLDCWGLLRYYYHREYGIELFSHTPLDGQLAVAAPLVESELIHWKETLGPTDGDAIAFGSRGTFYHVGIYIQLSIPSVIHTERNRLSSIQTISSLSTRGLSYIKFYRHADRTSYHESL